MAGSLLLVFNVHVLGVNNAFVLLLPRAVRTWLSAGSRRWACARTRLRSACRLSGLVHLLRQLVRGGGQGLARPVHLRLVIGLERLLGVGQSVFDVAAFGAGDLVTVLLQHLLDVVNHRVQLVLGFDRIAGRLVLGRMRVGFLRHALDFFLRQTGRGRDRDLLVFLRGRIFRGHVQNAIGVDVERNLDLRHATRSRRNSGQVELAKCPVLRRHWTLALQHVHFNRRLTISRGRERLRLLGRNRRVARDHRRGYATQRLDRQRQRSYVEQEQVFHFALEHASLNACADRDYFVRIHSFVAFASEEIFDQLLNPRHTGLSANQHDFVDLAGINASVLHALLAWTDRALNDVFNHAFELGARELFDQVLGTAGIGRNERQIDFGLHGGRELDLGALSGITQTLQGHLIALAAKVETLILLKFVDKPIHEALVDVVAAEVGVTVGGLDFDYAFPDFEDGDIERTAAKVVDRDRLVFAFVETIGKRGCRGLVDNALYFESGNLSCIFGCLPLRIIEVRRNGNHRFRDFLAEVVFRSLFQLLQNQRRNLGRRVFLALRQNGNVIALTDDLIGHHLDFFLDFVETASHEPLDGIDVVLGIVNRLPLGDLSDEPFAGLGETDYRRRSAPSFFVGYDLGLATFHNSNTGIGGSEVNSDNLCHKHPPELDKCFRINTVMIAPDIILRLE